MREIAAATRGAQAPHLRLPGHGRGNRQSRSAGFIPVLVEGTPARVRYSCIGFASLGRVVRLSNVGGVRPDAARHLSSAFAG